MVAPVVNMPNTVKAWPQSGRPTQLFTQHSGECPLAPGYARSLTNWSNTTPVQASWHSFVGPDERVRQVPWNLGAWTQGAANQYAIGMECAGYAGYTKAQWLTDLGRQQLENLAHEWVYYWRIEKSLGNEIPLRWLTTDEVRAVLNGNRTIKGFCTHGQIEPGSRWDPGPNFPFPELMTRIKQLIAPAPPVPAKPPAPAPKEQITMADAESLQRGINDLKAILLTEWSDDGWKTKKPGLWPVLVVNQNENRRNGRDIAAVNAKLTALTAIVAEQKNLSAEELDALVDKSVDDGLRRFLGDPPDFTQEPVVFPITAPEEPQQP